MTHAWRHLVGVGAVLVVSACTDTMLDDMRHGWQQDMHKWDVVNRDGGFREFFEVDHVLNTYAHQEREADKEVCLHKNGGTRILTQNGVIDSVPYTWCVLQPYGTDMGQRLDARGS